MEKETTQILCCDLEKIYRTQLTAQTELQKQLSEIYKEIVNAVKKIKDMFLCVGI